MFQFDVTVALKFAVRIPDLIIPLALMLPLLPSPIKNPGINAVFLNTQFFFSVRDFSRELGEAIFSPAIAQRMIQYFTGSAGGTASTKKGQADEFAGLTERELEILDLIAQGQNNSTIAIRLSLSIKTVQNYVSSILTKLQVADRAQAIVRAREAGFGKK